MKSQIFLSLILSLTAAAFAQLQELNLSQPPEKEPVSIAITRNAPDRMDTLSITLTLQMEKQIHLYSAESHFFKAAVSQKQGLENGTIELPKPKLFTNFDKTVVPVFVGGQKILLKHPIISADWSPRSSCRRFPRVPPGPRGSVPAKRTTISPL